MTITPPFPASYLADITSLPDIMLGQLDGRCTSLPRADERLMENSVRAIARHIRHAREDWERESGYVIEPEAPRLPPPGNSCIACGFADEDD